jgi:hypothetical protein
MKVEGRPNKLIKVILLVWMLVIKI